jgi:hypothetical protein
MTVKDAVIEKLEVMPTVKQQKVLEFMESMESNEKPRKPRLSLQGIWADLNINLTEEDLRQARNEMWRGYTRDTDDQK